ncbi:MULTISPECIES: Fic family protein [unclassified Methylobacterium]|uniref:Fic family protein n=1 Tax=unclassified Methylobacterium TaxID=2615210 RepID=UPI0036FEE625
MSYIYDRPEWPHFRWDEAALATRLAEVRHHQGRLLGRMEALGFELETEAVFQTLVQDALKTSEIEGESLDREQVRSSVARRLGLDRAGMMPVERPVEGLVAMLLDATQGHAAPLTVERLFRWHAGLFPDGGQGRKAFTVGGWRTDELGSMQVVSGPVGRERVHFRAPPAERITAEMDAFLTWFEEPGIRIDPVLKAAVAHIWFVTIHPFDDGNGRIARAIADLALARSEGTGQRFYSMSSRLRVERSSYYATLEAIQKGELDITIRLAWFLDVLDQALHDAETALADVIRKAKVWEILATKALNDRQRLMISRVLNGFQGKLTTSKWAQIAKCSQDTALRDIEGLITAGVFVKEPGGGRSTSYALAL